MTKRKKKNSLWILPSFLILGSLCFFLFQWNAVVSENYRIKECKERVEDLSKVNQALRVNLGDKNNLENIDSIALSLNFEKTGNVRYLKILEGSVVVTR